MVAVVRAVAAVLLLIAIVLNVVGFATNYWVSANLDNEELQDLMQKTRSGSLRQGLHVEDMSVSTSMGLWKYCSKINLGNDFASAVSNTEVCLSPPNDAVPDWMKAVRALGILAMLIAAVAIVVMIYSYIGDSKGDRARLLPHIIAGISLAAGMVLLTAVIVYATEIEQAMKDEMSSLGPDIAEIIKKNIKFGYSFALQAISGALYILVSLMLVIPVMMGCESAVQFDGRRNMAV